MGAWSRSRRTPGTPRSPARIWSAPVSAIWSRSASDLPSRAWRSWTRRVGGEFDLTFIDADKVNTPGYFAWSLEHSHPGSLIVADNSIRGGDLVDPDSSDPAAAELRGFHETLAAEARVSATTIQTVGVKGYDGFTIVLVEGT